MKFLVYRADGSHWFEDEPDLLHCQSMKRGETFYQKQVLRGSGGMTIMFFLELSATEMPDLHEIERVWMDMYFREVRGK